MCRVLLLDSLNQGAYISTARPAPCPPLLRRLQSTAFATAAAPAAAAAAAAAPVPELEAPNLANTWSASVLTQVSARTAAPVPPDLCAVETCGSLGCHVSQFLYLLVRGVSHPCAAVHQPREVRHMRISSEEHQRAHSACLLWL